MTAALMTQQTLMLPATVADLEALSVFWNDTGARQLMFDGAAVGPARARHLLDSGLSQAEAGLGWWLVRPRSLAPAIGCVGLLRSSVAAPSLDPPSVAVQMWIAFPAESWACGHAGEAVMALVVHAVHQLRLSGLSVICSVTGSTLDALLHSLGFVMGLEVDAGERRLRLYQLKTAPTRPAVEMLAPLHSACGAPRVHGVSTLCSPCSARFG